MWQNPVTMYIYTYIYISYVKYTKAANNYKYEKQTNTDIK
jgi:hypothetical protein